jgi:hypothetical protein
MLHEKLRGRTSGSLGAAAHWEEQAATNMLPGAGWVNVSCSVGKRKNRRMKTLHLLAVTAALGLTAFFGSAPSAEAAECYYRLHQDGVGIVTGNLAIQGYASALKVENACNRARRECNRPLDRTRKKGNVPRNNPRDLRCIRTSAG